MGFRLVPPFRSQPLHLARSNLKRCRCIQVYRHCWRLLGQLLEVR